jgi:hypothetical protein
VQGRQAPIANPKRDGSLCHAILATPATGIEFGFVGAN